MLTRIGGKESCSVPGGCTDTGDQDEFGVRISRPGWEARWKSRVSEPGHSAKVFPLELENLALTIIAVSSGADVNGSVQIGSIHFDHRILLHTLILAFAHCA